MDPRPDEILAALWRLAGGRPEALGRMRLDGAEPALPSSFRVDVAAQVSIAASALAAAEIWRLRTGRAQDVAVDLRAAAAEFRSERLVRVAGREPSELWDRIAGTYRCGDGRWVRLHTNFPHHRDGMLALLGCAHTKDAVAKALAGRAGAEFEQAAADAGLCASMMRSFAEWDAHPQGVAVAGLAPLRIERIGAAPPQGFAAGPARPLSGVRVLDLTRVIAGPVCGRTLAAHGAEVLGITAAHLPAVEPAVIDNGRGKLAARLDLRGEDGRAALRALAAGADVFLQGYRPGAIARHGFAPHELAALRPGIVCVSLSAYGGVGPWGGRRGFDSLVQTASGLNHAEAEAAGIDEPKALPCQALDHASGFLLALGAMAALARRVEEGGSWHVQVSLAATGRWLRSLGRLPNGLATPDPGATGLADRLETADSGFGALTAVRHAAVLSDTPARWTRPSMPLGSHAPAWPTA